MEEVELLRRGHVRVTNATLRIGDTSYPIRNITAVRVGMTKGSTGLPLTMLTIGVLCVVWKSWLALFFLPLAIFLFWLMRGQPALVLSTSGNEVDALVTRDEGLIREVSDALNNAIVRQHH